MMTEIPVQQYYSVDVCSAMGCVGLAISSSFPNRKGGSTEVVDVSHTQPTLHTVRSVFNPLNLPSLASHDETFYRHP